MALIEIGLRMIPLSSDVARAIREVVFCQRHGFDWGEARHRMAVLFSNPTLGGRPLGGGTGCAHPCLAAPNHGFTVIGWLYGRDFGDCLCKAVNRGYDTDCTGATLGALLGILHGAANLPERWRAPVGDGIVMSPQTSECGAPKDLHALTNRVVRLAGNWFEAGLTTVALGRERTTSASDRSRLSRNREALEILRGDDLHSAVESIDDLDIVLHYEGEPVLHPQLDKEIAVEVRCRGKPLPSPRIVIDGSVGWQVEPMENNRFRLRADRVSDRMPFRVSVHTGEREAEAGFMMLGPSEAEWPNMFWGVGRDPQTRKRIREDHALPPDPRDWPGISQRRSATS